MNMEQNHESRFKESSEDSTTTRCGRCKKEISSVDAETCWYCIEDLCPGCWDEYGHCGHPEADKANEEARKVNQPSIWKKEKEK
jgi:uncharacterized CHY-type Zn-finger protein